MLHYSLYLFLYIPETFHNFQKRIGDVGNIEEKREGARKRSRIEDETKRRSRKRKKRQRDGLEPRELFEE